MLIGKLELDLNHTHIMGILNVTPDSFSDGGKYNALDNALDSALFHAEEMIEAGAAIIDVGGESTRPGHTQISAAEEIGRTCSIIAALKTHFDTPISIDTYKADVAACAIDAGVDLINDIWGLKYDGRMADIIAKSQLPCCLMHNRNNANYNDFLIDVLDDLRVTLELADNANIDRAKIMLDPGIGFGKTCADNLFMVKNMGILHEFDLPLLLGTSRKGFIGKVLDLPTEQRVEGTLATTVMAVMSNYSFVRVHDIKANYRAIKMAEAIKYSTI